MVNRTKILVVLLLACGFAADAWADFKVDRRLSLAPGGTFTLETDVGNVVVIGDSTSGAQVTLTSQQDLDEHYDIRFEEVERGVRVTVKRRGFRFWNGGWWGNRTHFDIHVPTKTTVRVNTSGGSIDASRLAGPVDVHTSGGSVRVEDVDGSVEGTTSGGGIRMRALRGNVIAHTSGGGINITDVRGSLRADTSGGGIDIDTVTGDLEASTSGGGVDIRGAGGRVRAHSSGGPVMVRFVSGNARGGELSSSGGGVRAEVDPAVALSIDASSSGGGVTADVPVTVQGRISKDSLRGDLNGGGAVLRMRSSGGGVRIMSASRAATR
jgi:DUF4097 and DUF4098 domain-containing protein YvlB